MPIALFAVFLFLAAESTAVDTGRLGSLNLGRYSSLLRHIDELTQPSHLQASQASSSTSLSTIERILTDRQGALHHTASALKDLASDSLGQGMGGSLIVKDTAAALVSLAVMHLTPDQPQQQQMTLSFLDLFTTSRQGRQGVSGNSTQLEALKAEELMAVSGRESAVNNVAGALRTSIRHVGRMDDETVNTASALRSLVGEERDHLDAAKGAAGEDIVLPNRQKALHDTARALKTFSTPSAASSSPLGGPPSHADTQLIADTAAALRSLVLLQSQPLPPASAPHNSTTSTVPSLLGLTSQQMALDDMAMAVRGLVNDHRVAEEVQNVAAALRSLTDMTRKTAETASVERKEEKREDKHRDTTAGTVKSEAAVSVPMSAASSANHAVGTTLAQTNQADQQMATHLAEQLYLAFQDKRSDIANSIITQLNKPQLLLVKAALDGLPLKDAPYMAASAVAAQRLDVLQRQ
ncbi:unnamed protein product [Vitrella brassicaformis CCMP3155]|uniref:Uncharacterized protein n=1 Tax=Vitrella brassicaformis (strain CCMP3155) TaxID=1169540 RepID=A0A0G4FLW0_VITBC|nr:unnamed protein product [Vitrella brassicaformis CCMP3155]|eukprot:CEM15007.1 unnamed protein product [Vitrella brassicaformis CCMP3155]